MNNFNNGKYQSSIFDYIIIGAGISGIQIAFDLRKSGFSVLVIEKSKAVGGRIATRRVGQHRFDHGAQFIDLSFPDLSQLDSDLTNESIISPWFLNEKKWMKAAKNGMTQIPKFIAKNLDIVFLKKAVRINAENKKSLFVFCEDGTNYSAKNIVLSCPLPQSLKILDDSGLNYPLALSEVSYSSAIVALFGFKSSHGIFSEYIHMTHLSEGIQSINSQHSKGVSELPAFTMIMSPSWSAEFFELSENELALILREKFIHQIGVSDLPLLYEIQIKKWKFSKPIQTFDKTFFSFAPANNIHLIGDAFARGSIDGALISAKDLLRYLTS